jgi:hypothetical protein
MVRTFAMTQPISAPTPTAPYRDPDTVPPVIEHGGDDQSRVWFSDDTASFADVLDAVNPLHHIPVVSSVYRAVSGDGIGLGARLIGGAIFGGPLGLIFAGISALFEEASGGNIADHAIAFVNDLTDGDDSGPGEAIAALLDHAEGDASEGIETAAATAIDASPPTTAPSAAAAAARLPSVASAGERAGTAEIVAPVPRPTIVATTPIDKTSRVNSDETSRGQTLDSESQRIARALWDAQRAHASLLLANLRGHDATPRSSADEDRSGTDEDRSGDSTNTAPHVNLRPSGSLPDWYADAMQRALDKYQTTAAAKPNGP